MTPNEAKIIKLIYNSPSKVYFKDIEKVVNVDNGKDKFWSIFSTICSLIESNIITTTSSPSIYTLTEYGRSKHKEIT